MKSNKIVVYSYLLFTFLLTFPTPLIVKAIAAVVAIFSSLAHLYSHKLIKKQLLNRARLLGGFILFFTISLLGVFNSNHLQQSIDLIIRQLPILLFPLILIKLDLKDYQFIIKGFLFGILSYFLWVFIFDIYYLLSRNSIPEIDINYLRYINSVKLPYLMHWNYLGLYVNFGIISSMFILKKSKTTSFFLIISILITPIILGKVTIIILLTTTGIYLFKILYSNKKIKTFLSIILSLAILFSYILFELKDSFLRSFESRIILWEATLELWKLKPVGGYGTGSVQYIINSYLTGMNIEVPGTNSNFLDTHNIFAQSLVSHGIIGFASLLFFYGKSYWEGRKNTALLLLISITLVVGQVEHIFQRQWGVMLIAFFIPFITIHGSRKKNM